MPHSRRHLDVRSVIEYINTSFLRSYQSIEKIKRSLNASRMVVKADRDTKII